MRWINCDFFGISCVWVKTSPFTWVLHIFSEVFLRFSQVIPNIPTNWFWRRKLVFPFHATLFQAFTMLYPVLKVLILKHTDANLLLSFVNEELFLLPVYETNVYSKEARSVFIRNRMTIIIVDLSFKECRIIYSSRSFFLVQEVVSLILGCLLLTDLKHCTILGFMKGREKRRRGKTRKILSLWTWTARRKASNYWTCKNYEANETLERNA